MLLILFIPHLKPDQSRNLFFSYSLVKKGGDVRVASAVYGYAKIDE